MVPKLPPSPLDPAPSGQEQSVPLHGPQTIGPVGLLTTRLRPITMVSTLRKEVIQQQ